MTTGSPVRTHRDGPALHVVLDRPDQRNPLSVEMMSAVTDTLERAGADSDVRAVVLRGEGRVFSAGHDLREMVDRTLDDERRIFDVCTRMMQTVQRIPQPVIAQVHGVAAAAGCQLVAACDLAVAADDTLFFTPGVRIGLFCSTPMVALSRAVGRKRALEMLLTGDPVDAATAVEWGLVNRAVPADGLDAAVAELVAKLARSSPLTMAIGKRAFYEQIDATQDRAYELMGETMATNAMTCDAQEGIAAFLGKREPQWTGT